MTPSPTALDRTALEAAAPFNQAAWAEAVRADYNGKPLWIALADGRVGLGEAMTLVREYIAAIASLPRPPAPIPEGASEPVAWTPEKYAEQLAVAIREKHYPEVPQFEPMTGDIMGLLSQIDNMTAGMVRALPPPPARGAIGVASIRLRTEPRTAAAQNIVVSATLPDGREVDVIREHGALPDITIDHSVTEHGIREAGR